MSNTPLFLNTCPNCNQERGTTSVILPGSSQRCENCGSLIVASSYGAAAQKQRPLPTYPLSVHGPLLTGRRETDITLGFAGEIIGLGFILYAFYLFFGVLFSSYANIPFTFLTFLGVLATAFLLFKHADTMRERYPSFAHGWQRGRDTWGKVVEQFITLSFGSAVMVFTLPFWFQFVNGANNNLLIWLFVIVLAYLVGLLMRRIGSPIKGNSIP